MRPTPSQARQDQRDNRENLESQEHLVQREFRAHQAHLDIVVRVLPEEIFLQMMKISMVVRAKAVQAVVLLGHKVLLVNLACLGWMEHGVCLVLLVCLAEMV